MNASSRRWLAFAGTCALISAIASAGPVRADCLSDPLWLPNTPKPTFEKPPPHPAPDCGFYAPAWQNFLFVAQPNSGGNPAFLSFPTIADVFGSSAALRFARPSRGLLSLAPRALKGSSDPSTDEQGGKAAVVNAGARQAGLNGLLIDQRSNPVFYAIHMNPVFADFVRNKGITTKAALQSVDPNLALPKGAVELKSAWQIVPEGARTEDFITTRALVPILKQVGSAIEVDEAAQPREVTVALLAIHVAFALEEHPELVWATFEHIDATGNRDLAPSGAFPSSGAPDVAVSLRDFLLYKAGTPASAGNALSDEAALVAAFDAVAQNFSKNGANFQTSIFRYYPSSKLADGPEDQDVLDINRHVRADFDARAPSDKRRNYRLAGAVWLDHPETTFVPDRKLVNPPGVGPDDNGAVVVGEDGLSSMAMESFTQDSFVNCFSCHDTRQVKDNGVVLMRPGKLNVSHIFSKFVSDSK